MNKNNPIGSEPLTFYEDEHGQYFDENPKHRGLKKPKRFELVDISHMAKYEPVRVVRAVEPTLIGQEAVAAIRQAHLDSIGLAKKPNHKVRARAVLELERRRQVTLEREWKSQRGKS